MSPEPTITTVIPTRRRPELLRRAIRSVQDQTYRHFKICVYDNASADETAGIVKTMASQDPRIEYYCHPRDIGPQDNFIYGISRVTTPLIHLISDDDFLLPGFFSQAVTALEKNSGAAFFSGGILSAGPDGQVRGFVRYGSNADQLLLPPDLFLILAPYTRTWTSTLFRRSALEPLGGPKKETGYSFSIDLLLRAAIRFGAILSDEPCAVFTVHEGSSSVAEAAQAFASLLDLEHFASINQAIDSAQHERIVADSDARKMKALFRTVSERKIFHGALSSLVHGQLSMARHASDVLRAIFNRRDMAMAINAAARDNLVGTLLRFPLVNIKSARDRRYTRNLTVQHVGYSEMVKARMAELN
jgi:Glycosyl transferase family 2